MAAEDGEEYQNLIIRVAQAADHYVDSKAHIEDYGEDFQSFAQFTRIIGQVHEAYLAGEKAWNSMLEQRPLLCEMYVSAGDFISAATRGKAGPLTRAQMIPLLSQVTSNISSMALHHATPSGQGDLRAFIERFLAIVGALSPGFNSPKQSPASVSSPMGSPKKSPRRSPKRPSPGDVPDPRSPRLSVEDNDRMTKWYVKLVDIIHNNLPSWLFMYRASIVVLGLAICCGLYYWLIGRSISTLTTHKHERVPNVPVIFPNGTGVGCNMSDQLEAYNLHMQNTVKIYDSAESTIQHAVAGIIAETEKYAHSLEALNSPSWYGRILKGLGYKTPQHRDAEYHAMEIGTKVSRALHHLSSDEQEKLKNSFDQLDAHLYRIQESILVHDLKLQLSKFFHDLSHLQFSSMFEGIAEQDLAKSLAMLKMFNEKYRRLGEGVVFRLYKKIEKFNGDWNSMMHGRDKLSERIEKLKNLSWGLRESLKDTMRLKLSLDGRKDKKYNDEL